MNITPIRTEDDYRATLREISALMELDPDVDSPDGDRLDVLTTLVQAHEAKHFPVNMPNPVDALIFRMDQAGLSVKDLVPYIGPTNRVYEILNGERILTLRMIRNLHHGLNIPLEALIGEAKSMAA